MRTATLTRPHRRTSAGRACRRHSRTGTLKDRLAPLRHNRTRWRSAGCRTRRCRVHRTRSRLRHDQTPRRRSGLRRPGWWSGSTVFRGCGRARPRRRCNLGRRNYGRRKSFSCRRHLDLNWYRNLNLGLHHSGLGLNQCFGASGRLVHRARLCLRRSRRCRRLRRSNDRGGRTCHRLGCDKPGRRLGFNGRRRLGAGGRDSRPRRNRRRWRNDRTRWRGCSRARRRCRLCRSLRDRLQHITGFGDVRKINLGPELVRRCGRGTRTAARAGRLLCKVLFDPLGFIFFDRAGVRFLFSETDLGKNFEDFSALHLEFSCQIVDSNFVQHYAPFPPLCPVWLRLHSILTVVVDKRPNAGGQ